MLEDARAVLASRHSPFLPMFVTMFALAFAASTVPGAERGAVQVERVPDGGLYPQAHTDARGTVHLIYFKGDPMHGDVFYVRSTDGCATFSKPIRVNSQPRSVILAGTIRGPQMAVGARGRVHVAWMGSDLADQRVNGKETPMLYARLNDRGDAFEPQQNLIRQHPGLDGGGSVAADQDGNVYVAWHAPDKERLEADRQVWIVRSKDEGQTFGPETRANPTPTGACGCCGMKVMAGPKGEVYVLYRTATNVVNRDMHLLRSTDYGRTFAVVTTHPWQVGQCVMSTSSLAPSGASVLAAWETRQQVYVFRPTGSAGDVAKPTPAPGQGKGRKHPSLATAPDGTFVLGWSEGTGWNKGGAVAWQVFDPAGRPVAGQAGRADGLPVWSAPAVIGLASGEFRILY